MPLIYSQEISVTMMEQMSFHEASVVDFSQHGAGVRLKLEDALVDKAKRGIILDISPVANITIDGQAVDKVSMEAEDGEVLSLEYGDGKLSVIIEWHDFNSGSAFARSYEIKGGNVSIFVN